MTPFDDDELRRQLTSLGSDLGHTRLPGPGAARQRAAQRTRHQITTGVAAGIAVVALGGLGLAQLLGPAPDRIDPAPPPSTSPPTTEASPAPTPITIPDAALLIDEDIADDDGEAWTEVGTVDPPIQDCFNLDDYDADAKTWRQFLSIGTDSRVLHHLVRSPADGAQGLFDWVVGEVTRCVPEPYVAEGSVPAWARRVQVSGVGEEMWAQTYLQDARRYVEISVMRHNDLVSILVRTRPLTSVDVESGGGEQAIFEFDLVTPANAARRACTAVFGESCVTEPVVEDVEPPDGDPSPGDSGDSGDSGDETGDETGEGTEPGSPTDPADDPTGIPAETLTDDQVSPIGTSGDFTTGAVEIELARQSACVDEPRAEMNVETWEHAWTNGLDASFTETILRFRSDVDATAFVDAHSARGEPCGSSSDPTIEVSNTQPEPVAAGDAAFRWTVAYTPGPDNPGAGTSFFAAGVARSGDVAVILTFGAMGDPLGDGWSDYMEERLTLALDAATGG